MNSVGLLEIYSKIIKGMFFEAIESVMGPWLYRLTLSGVFGVAAEGHSLEEPQCCSFCTEWGIGEAGHGRHSAGGDPGSLYDHLSTWQN